MPHPQVGGFAVTDFNLAVEYTTRDHWRSCITNEQFCVGSFIRCYLCF